MTLRVIHGDCMIEMPKLPAERFHAVVTDPPYHLASIVKRFGSEGAAPAKFGTDGAYARASRGFMGQTWDGGDIAMRPETWAEVMRVMKPGAFLVAFGGTRTFHRVAVAIEDAGFEIRDTLCWLYGSGFPKSHNIAKAIDKQFGEDGTVIPTGEPVKRMIPGSDQQKSGWEKTNGQIYQPGRYQPVTPDARKWEGFGTSLKPSWEPIILARKPLIGTVAANVLHHGTGAIHIDACRIDIDARDDIHAKNPHTVGTIGANGIYGSGVATEYKVPTGRWPSNSLHDGSDEVMAAFAAFQTNGNSARAAKGSGIGFGSTADSDRGAAGYADSGTAARFFYSSKADKNDRVVRDTEEVVVEWTSETKLCQVKLRADTGQSPEKAIVESGSGTAREWSTFLSGSNITALCRRASSCIISTGTSWTTASKTWSALTHSLISASTADVTSMAAIGGSPVGNAGPNILSATITLGATESLPGAGHATSQTLLRISVNARRDGHATVKPVDLIRWLMALITPPGGHVLDPFAGSGTTGEAAMLLGFDCTMIEREAKHADDIRHRIKRWSGLDAPLFATNP